MRPGAPAIRRQGGQDYLKMLVCLCPIGFLLYASPYESGMQG